MEDGVNGHTVHWNCWNGVTMFQRMMILVLNSNINYYKIVKFLIFMHHTSWKGGSDALNEPPCVRACSLYKILLHLYTMHYITYVTTTDTTHI